VVTCRGSLRVAVVGGSVAGLATALFLARRGHRVQVFERDGTAPPTGPAGSWWRPATPQARHSHAFLARCRQVLAAEAPDVLAALLAAGVREVRLAAVPPPSLTGPVPADDRLVVLAGRRSVVEWTLRRALAAEPGVTVRAGLGVSGLWLEPLCWHPVRVMGVHLDDGSEAAADLVVDAAGRRSPVPGWLADAGAELPAEQLAACGITYYSRFYQLHDNGPEEHGGHAPEGLIRGYTAGGSYDRYSCLVFPADNGAFSVTFGVLPEDAALRGLRMDAAFDAAAATMPVVADWVDPRASQPLSGVSAMAGLSNRLRQLGPDDGPPAALGIVSVGDSACITNPAHTRGTALAIATAARLAAVVDTHAGDREAVALGMAAALRAELEPWYHDSIAQDRHRLRRWRPAAPADAGRAYDRGRTYDLGLAYDIGGREQVSNAEASLAAQRDPVVWSAFTALQNLLALPDEVLADPEVVRRTRAVLDSGWRPAPVGAAPGRDELVEIVSAAAAEAGVVAAESRTSSVGR